MWLLDAAIRKAMETAITSGVSPTAEQQAQFELTRYSEDDGLQQSRILTIAGDTAEVAIKGVLTKSPSLLAMIFGGGNTTYPEVVAALAEAERDERVKQIQIAMDSGGGTFDGLFDVINMLQTMKKPVNTLVSNLSASASYAIAAQTQRITAKNRAARFGSIGVAAEIDINERTVTLTSTKAPKKRPDVQTEEGRAAVIEELDALHELFAETVATGRRISADQVNADYGQGATLLADEALKRGMIDGIEAVTLRAVSSTNSPTASKAGIFLETTPMDLVTLKAQHPDVYAAVVQEGVTSERDRVVSHLTMGEASGDMKTAVNAIKDGSNMTATLQSTYMAAGMARKDIAARAKDDVEAAAAAAQAAAGGEGEESNVVAMFEDRFGLEA